MTLELNRRATNPLQQVKPVPVEIFRLTLIHLLLLLLVLIGKSKLTKLETTIVCKDIHPHRLADHISIQNGFEKERCSFSLY